MGLRNASADWGWLARWLHWLMAIGLLATALIGWIADDLASTRDRYEAMVWHKSIGLSLLGLLFLRLAWRMSNPTPQAPPGMPRWQRLAASTSHALLYLLMLWMPVTGWLAHSASGLPLRWFGWWRVPSLLEKDSGLKHLAEDLHQWGLWLLVALVTVHVLAALKHHFVNGDTVLVRMLGWGGKRSSRSGGPFQ